MEPPKNQRLSVRRARVSTPETKNPFDAIDSASPIQSPGFIIPIFYFS